MNDENESPLAALAIFLIFFTIAFRVTFSAGAAGFLHDSLADLAAFLALALATVATVRPGARALRVNMAAGALIFFALILFISASNSHYPRGSLVPLSNTAALACLFVAASGFLFQRVGTARAAVVITGLAVMAGAGALYQYWELPQMLAQLRESTPPVRIGNIVIDEKHFADFLTRIETREVFATFLTSNVFAGFLALAFVSAAGLAAGTLAGGASRRFRAAWAGTFASCALLFGILIILTKSKSGLLAAAAGLFVLLLVVLVRLPSRRTAITVICVAGAVAAAGILFAPRAGQLINEARTSLDVRFGYWRTAGRVIRGDVAEGVGPGHFETFYYQQKQIGEREVRDPHNVVLKVFAEGGLFSLVFFAGFWVLVFSGQTAGQRPRAPSWILASGAAFPAAVLVQMGLVHMHGGLTAQLDLYPLLALLGGSLVAASIVWLYGAQSSEADDRLVRAGIAAGLAAFLISCMADMTFSDAGAATVAIFGAAAIASGGKAAALQGATIRTAIVAAVVIAGLLGYVGKVFVPVVQAEAAADSARAYLAEGNTAPALRHAETALSLDPRNADLHALLGNIREAEITLDPLDMAAFTAAQQHYLEALAINCWQRAALEGLFRIYSVAEVEEADAIAVRLLESYPSSNRYNLMVARLYDRTGRSHEALALYRRALHIDDHTEQHGIQFSESERREIADAISRLESEGAS